VTRAAPDDPTPPRPVAKRVFFHVGAPKTGTTYLQNVLFHNRDTLAKHQVLYPYEDQGQSFRSMLDFRGAGWGGSRAGQFSGEWDKVAGRVRAWPGDVIVSNELLGGSTPDRIEAGLASIGPADVHVVFTARDLARQLVSDWQEHIKHKHTVTLETFVEDLVTLGLDAPAPFGQLFWGMHDAAYVLQRWARYVPPSNIHIVTVPHPGAPADTLWTRFCAVTGLDPHTYDTDITRANASMGVAETELVRRMNADVQGMPAEVYDPLVRKLLAEDILGGKSPKLTLPPEHLSWVSDRSRRLIEEVGRAGYQVEGDLEELMPRESEHLPHVSPTTLTDAELADAAIRAATGLLRHSGRQRRRNLELQQQLDSAAPSTSAGSRLRARLTDGYWALRHQVAIRVKRR
jgi:hypothetical protein